MQALAATRDKSACEILPALTPHGNASLRSQQAALTALAQWASQLRHRQKGPYRETLEDILRDPMERVRLRKIEERLDE